MKAPRIMIAATGSGSGKTLLTCALLKMLLRSGKRAAAFKCGPDYIDPAFHREVLSVPSKNLDTFFTGKRKTKALFMETAALADISVIEGVMGLFDGTMGTKGEASSYQLASVLKAPVLLVVDGHGMGRSLLPLIAGFLTYDTEKLIKGVILNRVSKSFYERIRPEIEAELPVRVIGYFPYREELKIKSRYLGLKLPHEVRQLQKKVTAASKVMEETVDMEQLLWIAEQAEELEQTGLIPEKCCKPVCPGVRIGVAMDEAFCFYYEDNLRLMREMGAELVPFSPIHDAGLPKGLKGLLLGGGYPELYAGKLSGNESMRSRIAQAVRDNMPTIAECGGFLYLHERMNLGEQGEYPMAGVIKATCFRTGRPVRFGYVEIKEHEERFLKKGETVKGHEFHYFDSTDNGIDCTAKKPGTGKSFACVHVTENSWLGFAHLYYASNLDYIRHFMERAALYGR